MGVLWSKYRWLRRSGVRPASFFESTPQVPRRAPYTGRLRDQLVDKLSPRVLGIDEHRFRSVRYFQDPGTKAWTRFEPWMTTIVDLDTGQVLGVVDGRDHKGVGDWLLARPLEWRLAVQVVAIDPSAAFRKALRMWLPRTAVGG